MLSNLKESVSALLLINGLVIILQVPVLPPNMHWDEADLEPTRVFLSEAAGAGLYVPCPGLSWSTKPIM